LRKEKNMGGGKDRVEFRLERYCTTCGHLLIGFWDRYGASYGKRCPIHGIVENIPASESDVGVLNILHALNLVQDIS